MAPRIATILGYLTVPVLLLLASPMARCGDDKEALTSDSEPPAPGPQWRVSLGGVSQRTGNISFNGGGFSSMNLIEELYGLSKQQNSALSAAGPLGAYANREYEDGFVRLGSGTGDPAAIDPTATTNWGYTKSSQVQGDTLSYHETGTSVTTTDESHSPGNTWSDNDNAFGPSILVDLLLPLKRNIRFGPQFGFSYGNVGVDHQGSTFQASESAFSDRLTDIYNLQGVVPPPAPYQGSFFGPGPLISDIPSQRTITDTALNGSGGYRNLVHESFNSDFYNFSLGLNLEIDATSHIFLFGSGGFSARIADYDSSYDESLYLLQGKSSQRIKRWSSTNSGVDALFGGFLQGGFGLRITKRISVIGFARYDWLENLDGSVGTASFHWNTSGVSAGFYISYLL
jgi:hypothetical protein